MNLEGAVRDDSLASGEGVYSHPSLLAGLSGAVTAVFLANNHLGDSLEAARQTFDRLQDAGLPYFGAGRDDQEAHAACLQRDEDVDYCLLGFGWRVIGARSREASGVAVAEMNWQRIERAFYQTRARYPSAKIVVNLHWNYELELYPQPAHRELAHALVGMGAAAVIGHHPHMVGGYELVDGKPIVYSLGNWWFPQGVYDNGKVRFPESSYLQLAFELKSDGRHLAHWYQYDPGTQRISHTRSELADVSADLSARTPFNGLSHREYSQWFRENRLKRKWLPVFSSYKSPRTERLLEGYVWLRHQGLMALQWSGLRRVRGL